MQKKHLLGFLAGSFLLAGCFHDTGQTGTGVGTQAPGTGGIESQVPVPEGAGVEEAVVADGTTVRYTDSGFVPSSLTVDAGTTVTFINESSGGMWVASAVHPTHQELPGFDQRTSVGNGESYRYTFAEAGQWRYHNHISANHTGVIVVE